MEEMSRPTSASAALSAGAPLDLLEEPRVLERHAHACGHRGQQAQLRVAERVLALMVGHRQLAQHAVAAVGTRMNDSSCSVPGMLPSAAIDSRV
ncbi:MAG: hypothetical protein U1F10_15980 [Burkholderiales bacterium]